MEKRYLVQKIIDVADEGDVGVIKVLTESELNEIKTIRTGFGNLDGDRYRFNKSCAVEITEEQYKVLKDLGLTDLEFGYCDLSDEPYDDEDYDDEDYDDEDEDTEDSV